MLFDRARIYVQAGPGGNGCTSFRREAHVPRGGPDGGDGGRGAEIVLLCDDSLRDLQGFRRRSQYKAPKGGHGEGAQRHGANGEQLLVKVPPGTQVSGEEGELEGRRWDLVEPGQRVTIAKGGSGGRGNKRFATASRQAPRFSERGLPGEEGWISLQLKLLADVGLVGLPNAGKSSLLSRLTRATPKVAGYPFTTLEPNLGVLDDGERQLILADIPGLIEGASDGAGLGHDFLAHIERTRLIVHVLDLAPELSVGQGEDPVLNHELIERELESHDERLMSLPRVLALSKADLVGEERTERAVKEFSALLGEQVKVIATSSATGAGLSELSIELLRQVPASTPVAQAGFGDAKRASQEAVESLAEHMVFRPVELDGFTVERVDDHVFAVTGKGVERLLQRFDVDNEEAMAYFEGRLRRMGVLASLESNGFQPGDEINIAGVAFELDPAEPE